MDTDRGKGWAWLVGLAVWAWAGVVVAQEEGAGAIQLGYVDIQHALAQVEDGREAMSRLERELGERQEQLDTAERELREYTEQLDEELVMLDADTRRQRLQEYQGRVEAYQQLFMENQRALYEMEQEATREIVERMLGIVQEIARERNLTMVFEKTRSALVWAQEDLDLTDELIRRYESGGD